LAKEQDKPHQRHLLYYGISSVCWIYRKVTGCKTFLFLCCKLPNNCSHNFCSIFYNCIIFAVGRLCSILLFDWKKYQCGHTFGLCSVRGSRWRTLAGQFVPSPSPCLVLLKWELSKLRNLGFRRCIDNDDFYTTHRDSGIGGFQADRKAGSLVEK